MAGSLANTTELTAEQVEHIVISPLQAQSVVLSSGPRVFTASTGQPIKIPKLNAFPISNGASPVFEATAWTGENELVPEVDPTWDEVTLLPTALKSLKVIHRFSNELARHAVVNIANTVRDALVREMALLIDRAFLTGEGTGNTVIGLANADDIQTQDATSGFNLDVIHDAHAKALNADAEPSVWFLSPNVFTFLRKIKVADSGRNDYVLQPDPQEANRYRLVGTPVRVTTQLPDTAALLVDVKQVAVGRDLGTQVKLLDQTYADWDQLALRVVSRFDIAPLNPAGIVLVENIDITP